MQSLDLDLDLDVVKYLGHGKIKSSEETSENLNKILNDYKEYRLGLFSVRSIETHEFLGRSGLIPWIKDDSLTCEIGYSLVKSAWGKGYATEVAKFLASWARENLNVPHVVSYINPLNADSIKAAEKVGMKCLGPITLGNLQLSAYMLQF